MQREKHVVGLAWWFRLFPFVFLMLQKEAMCFEAFQPVLTTGRLSLLLFELSLL